MVQGRWSFPAPDGTRPAVVDVPRFTLGGVVPALKAYRVPVAETIAPVS
jgi:hypothetical protein